MVQVVFHTAFIGDLILTIPFLRYLKSKNPEQRLILVCRPSFRDFFIKNKLVDEVIGLDKRDAQSVRSMHKALEGMPIDKLYCIHRSFHSAWILRSVRAKAKFAYWSWWNGLFFDHRVRRPMDRPEVLRVLALVREQDPVVAAWCDDVRWKNSEAKSTLSFQGQSLPDELSFTKPNTIAPYKGPTPYVVLAPGSQWLTKRWTKNGFVELGRNFLRQGFSVYLVGAPDEKPVCDEILSLLRAGGVHLVASQGVIQPECRSFAGQTDLVQLQSIITGAQLVVANDSGAMHMAAFVSRPVVGVFGPTTPELGYRPWTQQATIVQTNLSCRPCGPHGHKVCPLGTHDCMKKISADQVLEASKKLLEPISKNPYF